MLRSGSTATLGRLTTPHWSGYTSSSPDFSPVERSQIVLDYVPAGVKVSIKRETAMLTNKVRLVNSIRAGNVSAPTTLLRGVACIYVDNPYSLSLCFILYKLLKLCKVPAVYPASILLVNLNPLPDSLELLKNNYSTSRNEGNYFLSYFVVNSSPKPFLLLRKFLKVSFSRRSAFGLQSLAKCKVSFRYGSNVSTVKEPIDFSVGSGDNCKFSESQVHSNTEVNRFYIWKVFLNGNVEEKLFELFVIFEVSRGNLPVQILLEVIRNFYFKLLSSTDSSKGHFFSVEPNGIRTLIVANNRIFALWTPAFESLFLSLDCRFETFSSYDSCRDYKLGRERSFVSDGVVGEFVELDSVPSFGFPPDSASVVVSELILFKRFKEYLLLFFGRFKDEFESS